MGVTDVPASTRAVQLDSLTRVQLKQMLHNFALYPEAGTSKRELISMILRKEGYSTREVENRGPVALSRLFPL